MLHPSPSKPATPAGSESGPGGGFDQAQPPDETRVDDVVGNLVDLQEGEILLPSFVLRKQDGLYIDLALLEKTPDELWQFVTLTFASGAYFSGIDYRIFQALLFEPEHLDGLRANPEDTGRAPPIRFADSIARIPEVRKPLYRTVKIAPNYAAASYLFEPLILDKTAITLAEDGSEIEQTVSEPAYLNFDEFVAHLWNRGVRYGLLEAEIRARMADEQAKPAWLAVARQFDPAPGKDAEIREVFDKLHRDRSPTILFDGKVDLRHFKNTFPQVGQGVRLIRKIPRVIGAPGRDVAGFPIQSNPPKDLDLSTLAGNWVEWEDGDEGEFLVATRDGFVNIDTKTQQFFITERLVNRDGISVRTTGSLNIQAEEFEEHGDVEQGFSVTGHSIRVKGNVYGSVISKGGIVDVRGNVLKGEVRNADGPIEIGGFASHAHIESTNGEVRLSRAENSVIRARTVILEEVRNCTVVADYVEIGSLQNCVVGGKAISVGRAGLKSGYSARDENILVLDVPDLAELERSLEDAGRVVAETELALAANKADAEKTGARYREIVATPVVRAYLENARKVKEFQAKGGVLTAEQNQALTLLRSKLAHELTEISELSNALKTLDAEATVLEKTLEEWRGKQADDEARVGELSEGVSVRVLSVSGETTVRTRKVGRHTPRLSEIDKLAELRKELDSLGTAADRLFQSDSGRIEWMCEPLVGK